MSAKYRIVTIPVPKPEIAQLPASKKIIRYGAMFKLKVFQILQALHMFVIKLRNAIIPEMTRNQLSKVGFQSWIGNNVKDILLYYDSSTKKVLTE